MNVIIEGPDACGKSTLAKKLVDKYNMHYVHFPSADLETHMNSLLADNTVFDRFHIGELVYPEIYDREPKFNGLEDANKIMKRIVDNNDILIIFRTSDLSILNDRLIARGELDYLEEIDEQNKLFTIYSSVFDVWEYNNYYVIDIAEDDAYDKLDAWIDSRINKTTMNTAYKDVCKQLLENGTPIEGGDLVTRGNSRELTNFMFTIDDISNNVVTLKSRNTSLAYVAGETLWYWVGRNDLNFISKFAKLWSRISDDGVTCNSAYGYILKYKFGFDQIETIIELLKNDKNTRRAVLNINTPNPDVSTTKDEMCTIALVFQIRDNKLNCTGIMRSNDLIYGLTYDLTYFTQIQKYIAKRVGVKVGSYTHFTTSMHVYEKDFELLEKIAKGNLDSIDYTIDVDYLTKESVVLELTDYIDNHWEGREEFMNLLKSKGIVRRK